MRFATGLFVLVVLSFAADCAEAEGVIGAAIPIIVERSSPSWVEILQALMTPTVAIGALAIGFFQLHINSQKLKVELFDRRLKIYWLIRKTCEKIIRNGHGINSIKSDLNKAEFESNLLFDNIISGLVRELYNKNAKSVLIQNQISNAKSEEDRFLATDEQDEFLVWIKTQWPEFDKRMARYMEIDALWSWKLDHSPEWIKRFR